MKTHNFYAGPAILPAEVLDKASRAVKDFDGTGLSLVEISHRSKEFVAVMDRAQALVREIYALDDSFEVLFLQGGASTQFCMVPYNLLPTSGSAAYLETGSWAKKAVKEAKLFGNVDVVASSADKNFNYIPKDYEVTPNQSYLHITTNNTIYGTEIHDLNGILNRAGDVEVPVVADMSSDIFAKPIDAHRFGMIYAGAQKNLGPAGTTLVIINKSLLGKADRQIPTMLDYRTHIEKESMFNTPPVFAVYTCMLTLEWIKEQGGLGEMAKRNKAKADLLYNEVDRNPLFTGTTAREDRSLMNATFVMTNADLEPDFQKACSDAGLVGIKGHRSVGGFRASLYNALPIESVEVLVGVMKDFEQKHG